jgi:hypothetical protein
VPASSQPGSGAPARSSSSAQSSIVIPTEDGGFVRLRDPVKTVGEGYEAVELRSHSPEERASWKLKKNLIMWGFGLAVIGITLYVLLKMGPLSF